ncbi:TetR/AcrR family transcriptional regulator [Kribbella voronezhensis]|nr:TetR/AcrR family transcriptional regulator [Kribbella voronezhensis]
MRSSSSDLTARAQIRDRALELFAQRGPDAVTVRDIAASAGVSPGLVIHHFGSKQGLREVVDSYVAGIFDEMFAAVAGDPAMLSDTSPQGTSGLAELMLTSLPTDSPVPAYLRRLLLTGDGTGRELFRRWYAATAAMTEQLSAAGVLRPAEDPAVRAAFLLVNDLAVVLLRDHLTDVLGIDPLTPDGMRRWAADVVTAYTQGVFGSEES